MNEYGEIVDDRFQGATVSMPYHQPTHHGTGNCLLHAIIVEVEWVDAELELI